MVSLRWMPDGRAWVCAIHMPLGYVGCGVMSARPKPATNVSDCIGREPISSSRLPEPVAHCRVA